MLPTRQEALELLQSHVKEDYQILHAKMVAAAMEAYYEKFKSPLFQEGAGGVEQDLWYITGLLHDIDYYEHPTEHPSKSLEWFKEWGYPEDLIHAVEAHAFGYNGFATAPKNIMAAALMACDEAAGLIYAYSLMRPEGMKGMEAKGVQKRFKDKGFAAKINRDEVTHALEQLSKFAGKEITLAEHAQTLIDAFNKMEEFE